MAKRNDLPWQDKIINNHQIGGIETAVIDNGPGRGTRIAWINTGTGLRYKVVIDRGLDIVDAFYNEHSLTFLSHLGISNARPDAHTGLEWLRTFAVGLVTTCGLSQAGMPNGDENEQRGLHGRYSNLTTELISVVQPDIRSGKLDMSITGLVKESSLFGPNFELRRTISSTLGQPTLKITDVLTNCSSEPQPHMMLYHCNFGWPLVDAGTDIVWKGKIESTAGRAADEEMFNSKNNPHKCSKAIPSHRGAGEACAFIDVTPDSNGICTVGLHNAKLGLALAMRYPKKTLPKLTNWQHWGIGEYVTGIEPGTNHPIGQAEARRRKELIMLGGGKQRSYELEISIMTNPKDIAGFLKNAAM